MDNSQFKVQSLTEAGMAKDLSDITMGIEAEDGRIAKLTFDFGGFVVFAQKAVELLKNVQIRARQIGSPIPYIPTQLFEAEAELAPETGRISLGVRAEGGPIFAYSLTPELARTLGNQLLAQANLAEQSSSGRAH